jgi:sugar lactone lactonase YvrE
MECLVDARCQVGESPVWDAQQGRLFWVDVLARTVFALDTGSGQLRRWTFEGPVGSLGLTRTGRLVVAIGLGIYLFDLRTEALSLLVSLDDEPKTNRVNDGKVGPDGAFWIGTMDDRPVKEAVAALYRVTADGTAERKITGLVVSNGLAWSADGQMMAHSDSRACWIDRWTFDPGTGHISGRTRLRTLTNEEGRPDGAATDCDGGYWSAGVSAGCLNRFSMDGALLDRMPMPVPQPTMPCFGGPDMRTLFVTSLSDGQSEEVRSRYPQSGGVFQTRGDVAGVPVGLFTD